MGTVTSTVRRWTYMYRLAIIQQKYGSINIDQLHNPLFSQKTQTEKLAVALSGT